MLISKTIAADPHWRVVTATDSLVRAIPRQLEEALPSIGSSRDVTPSAWLTLHFWIDNRPKPRLGVFWRATAVNNREARNRILKSLLETGGTGFEYTGTKDAWGEIGAPAFSGETVSNEWWPSAQEPDLVAASTEVRNQLRIWNNRLPDILGAIGTGSGSITGVRLLKRQTSNSENRITRATAGRVVKLDSSVVNDIQFISSKIKLTPPLPQWVKQDLFQPYYTNIHELLKHPRVTLKRRTENSRRLYGTETMDGFNDWDAPTLLLAKDAGPMQTFLRLIETGDQRPWRHADERDSKGTPTNVRLRNFASILPGTKLYGSVMAGLLRNDGKQRGSLPNFDDPKLQAYLRRILNEIVFPGMKNLRVVICLGNEACQIVGTVIDRPRLAWEFDTLRRAAEPIEYEGKLIFAAWHPVASEPSENVRRVWAAAAKALAAVKHKK